jgi:hypothetical protein
MGIVSDGLGAFHPLWSDDRSGRFMVETATIQVQTDQRSSRDAWKTELQKTKEDLSDKIELLFDPEPPRAGPTDSALPVRLKNVSHDTIYGPIVVTVTGAALNESRAASEDPEYGGRPTHSLPVSSIYDYTLSFGDSRVIAPGAVSDAIVWHFTLSNPMEYPPPLRVNVTGFVRK